TGGHEINKRQPDRRGKMGNHKMKWNRLFIGTLVGAQIVLRAIADDTTPATSNADLDTLKKQIQALENKVEALEQQKTNPVTDDLDQKVRILEREREIDREAAATAAASAPKFNFGSGGFVFTSADSNFV